MMMAYLNKRYVMAIGARNAMSTKMALIVSGMVTIYVMAFVIWVLGGFGWFAPVAQVSPAASSPAMATAPASTDVATLQQEVATYRQELQQANSSRKYGQL
jgi:hypothetical protein